MVAMAITLFLGTGIIALFLGRLAEILTRRYRERTKHGGSKGPWQNP